MPVRPLAIYVFIRLGRSMNRGRDHLDLARALGNLAIVYEMTVIRETLLECLSRQRAAFSVIEKGSVK